MKTKEELTALINKNKQLLIQELNESRELIKLLRKSTHHTLSDEEKLKVKNQLLDILKGIPVFAIFLLPGGAVLLPLLIKLIPSLLPSAFREKDIDS